MYPAFAPLSSLFGYFMKNKQSPTFARSFLAALVFISMIGPLGMNIILPSLSAYQDVFNTDYASAQLTLTFYLAAIAVAQLIYGPVSDRLGRLPIIFFGLTLFMVGSVVSLMATSIEMLVFGRIIQAFGGCAGMVMARAMVRDRFDAENAASLIAYMTMAIVVAPTLAPALGGVLEDQFGWQGSFVFVLGFAVIVLGFVLAKLRETLPAERRHDVHFSVMFLAFFHLLRNPAFTGYALQVSFFTSAYFAFLGGSSFVMVDLMGLTASELGLIFVGVSVLYILGNFFTARLAKKFGVPRLILFGSLVSVAGAVLLLAWHMLYTLGPISFLVFMALIAFGNGFGISSGLAAAVGADPSRVGAASGLAGALQIGFGALSTYVTGSLLAYYETTPTPLLLVILGCCVLGLLSFVVGRYKTARMSALETY